ncbi:MAG: hypothetical protein ACLGIW_08065 [Gammaproteobacteria bacterium]
MKQVLVDRELLDSAATWLEVHAPCGGCVEGSVAEDLRAILEQPAEAEVVGHDTIVCRNCKQNVTLEARDDEDGFCPHCMCELDLSDYLINANAALSAVTAERAALREQVKALQSDANSWQSGYDKGRNDGTKHRKSEIDQLRAEAEGLRKDAERYRWLRDISGNRTLSALAKDCTMAGWDSKIDAAMAAKEA